MLIDLVEHCHVWWIPSLKGVQKVKAWRVKCPSCVSWNDEGDPVLLDLVE